MLEKLLQAVLDRLSGVAGFRYVGEDWGQLDSRGTFGYSVQMPCALADIESADYEQVGKNIQECTVMLSIRVADIPQTSILPGRPTNADHARELFTLMQSAYIALQGLSPEGCTPLTRCALVRRRGEDNSLREFEMRFRCGFTDTSAEEVPRYTAAQPEISFEKG